ncbi:MAG: PAS domain S-box protein [Anaerolineales bacterium]|nr:PAS domain S-box protein [Anaerolineales bacterium]
MNTQSLLEKTERIAQIGFWELNLVTGIGICSSGFFAIHGMEDPGVVYASDFRFMGYLEDMPFIERAYADALTGVRPYDIEHRITRRSDAQSVTFMPGARSSATSRAIRSGCMEPPRTSQSKQIRLAQAQLAAIVEHTDVAIFGIDLNINVISWNQGAEKLFGYSPAEAFGRPLTSLIAPDHAGEIARYAHQLSKGAVISNLETRCYTKDGSMIHVMVTISPVRDANGVIIGGSSIAHDISRLKQMEEALCVRDERLTAVLENSADRIWAVDVGYGFVICNESFRTGIIDLIGREFEPGECVLHPAIPEPARNFWQGCYDRALRGETFNVELHTQFQPEMRHRDYRVSPMRNARGEITGVVVSDRDITQRTQAEAALREHESRLDALIESLDERIWAVDTEYRLVVCNERFHEGTTAAFGRRYATGECLLDERVGEAPRTQWQTYYDRALRGERLRVETPASYQDSTFEYYFNPVIDDTGQVIGAAVHGRDITARKQAEEAVKISLTKYLTLFESVPVGITITNDQGKILETNSAAERVLGVPRAEHEQRTFDSSEWIVIRADGSLMPPDEFASVRALKEQRLIENSEMGMVSGSGSVVWISMNATPIQLPGYGVVIAYTDITARKSMEEELHDLNEQLELRVVERTAQLEAALVEVQHASELKDAFLASVSHELRTPLTGVLGLADVLETQTIGELNERRLHYVHLIHQSGERLNAMISSILDYTALLAGKFVFEPCPCRLVELAASALHRILPAADARSIKLKLTA